MVQFTEDHLNEIKEVARKAYYDTYPGMQPKEQRKDFEHYWNTALILLKNNAEADTIVAGLLHGLPKEKIESLNLKEIRLKGGSKPITLNNVRVIEIVKNFNALRTAIEIKPKIETDVKQLIDLITQTNDPQAFLVHAAQEFEKLKPVATQSKKFDKSLNTQILKVKTLTPIAQALNYYKLVSDMEDLVFKLENKSYYEEISDWIKKQNYEEKLLRLKENLLDFLGLKIDENGKIIPTRGSLVDVVEVQHRVKTPSSIYRKAMARGISYKKIHDVKGLRIIVKRGRDVIPLAEVLKENGFTLAGEPYLPRGTPAEKNYVENPKRNGYKAYHLIGWLPGTEKNAENLVELQIVGEKMHAFNEYGPPCRVLRSGELSKETKKFGYLDLLKETIGEQNAFYTLKKILGRDFITVSVIQPDGEKKSFKVPAGTTVRELAVLNDDSFRGLSVKGAKLKQSRSIPNGVISKIKVHLKKYLGANDKVVQGDVLSLDYPPEKNMTEIINKIKKDLGKEIKNLKQKELINWDVIAILSRDLKNSGAKTQKKL